MVSFLTGVVSAIKKCVCTVLTYAVDAAGCIAVIVFALVIAASVAKGVVSDLAGTVITVQQFVVAD